MADQIPVNFPIPQETAIASFPYQDIQEGTGLVHYMAARFAVDTTPGNDVYSLVTSKELKSMGYDANNIMTLFDQNDEVYFDVTFNTPKIIDGLAYVQIATFQNGALAFKPHFKIVHYDGSTETVVTAYQEMRTTDAANGNYQDTSGRIDVPRTKWKKGEILRVYVKNVAGSNTVYMGHDPTAGSTNWTNSGGRSSFFIPFAIGL